MGRTGQAGAQELPEGLGLGRSGRARCGLVASLRKAEGQEGAASLHGGLEDGVGTWPSGDPADGLSLLTGEAQLPPFPPDHLKLSPGPRQTALSPRRIWEGTRRTEGEMGQVGGRGRLQPSPGLPHTVTPGGQAGVTGSVRMGRGHTEYPHPTPRRKSRGPCPWPGRAPRGHQAGPWQHGQLLTWAPETKKPGAGRRDGDRLRKDTSSGAREQGH